MSCPDPLYDADNSYEDDEMFTEPDESDVPFAEYLYDDYEDFHGEALDYEDDNDDVEEEDDVWDDSYDDGIDGDFDSGMRDAGYGTDEDYGYYGENY
jgi:hypothetical protein